MTAQRGLGGLKVHTHSYADADFDDAPSGGATLTPSRFRNPSMSSSKHRS